MTAEPVRRRGIPWLLLALGGIAFAILLSLGTWQVKRLHWKEGLLATIAERTARAPVPLAEALDALRQGSDIEYLPVSVSGTFNHEREQFFFATWNGQAGYYVYTPMAVEGDGGTLFVNRGFVPFDRKDPAMREDGQVTGMVTVEGLARNRLSGKPSFIVPENDPAKNIFYWKDLDAMAGNAGLDPAAVLPLFVDANDMPNPGGLPIGGVTLIQLPNNHLQYAITWYGLALALAGVMAAYLWKRSREPVDGQGTVA